MRYLPTTRRRALPWLATALVFLFSLVSMQATPAGAVEAPTAGPDSATTAPGVPVSIAVLENDSDPEMGPLTITTVGEPANGTAVIAGDTIIYTPNPEFTGDDTFTYIIEDDEELTAVGIVTVTVTVPVNNPPVAVDDVAVTPSNTPVQIPVLANDFDPDGHAISISAGALARAAISDLSPVLHWECLPIGSPIVADRSGYGRDGVVTGVEAGAATGDCDGGTSMAFWSWAGANVTTSVPGLPSGSASRSVLLRFKANFTSPGDIGLFGLGANALDSGQFSIARTGMGNDQLYFASWGNDAVLSLPAGTNIGDGAEHTIVIVYDGGTGLTAYVDGVAGPTTMLGAPLATADGVATLGQTLYGSGGAGDEMRQFAIFPIALNGTQVAGLHGAINGAAASQALSQPAHGTAVLVGDEVLYSPNTGFTGTDSFSYSISDGQGGIAGATVTVTVVGGDTDNEPPVAADDFATTPVSTPILIDVLANDTDPDGDTLLISPGALARAAITGQNPLLYWECMPAGGAATIVDRSGNGRDGTVTGTAAGAATGDCDGGTALSFFPGDSVTRVNPGLPTGAAPRSVLVRFKANVASGDVGLFGMGANEAVFGQFSIARTGLGNDQLYFASWANDTVIDLPPGTNLGDGAEHTIVIVYDGANGLTAYVDGVAGPTATLWQPLDTVDGLVTLGRTLYDNANYGDEMRQFAVFATALDAEQIGGIHAAISGAAALQAFTQPANGTVALTGNALTYTPNIGFIGEDSFTYSVSDGKGGVSGATVTVTVTPDGDDNLPPVAVDDTATTMQGQPVLIDVLANDTDPDGDELSISPGALARAAIDGLNPLLHWECLPAGGAATIVDRTGNGRDGVVTGTTPGATTGDCDGGTSMAFFPGDSVSLASPDLPTGASPRSVMLRFKANVASGDVGLFGLGTNGEVFGQFSIARTGLGNDKLYFASWANDAVLDLPAGTNLGDGAEHTIVIVYDGGTGLTAYVDGVAGPTTTLWQPLNTIDGQVTLGQTLYGAMGFGDELRQFAVYGGALSDTQIADLHAAIHAAAAFQAFSQPANGTVALTGNAVTYTPDPEFVGEDSFTYSVSDGRGGIAAATVTVTVMGGLLAVDDIANVLTNQPVVIDVLGNDSGADITIQSVTQPVNGTVTLEDNVITYTSNPEFIGTDQFTYTIVNPDLNTSTATVVVLVAPDNLFPNAVDDSAVAPFETAVEIPVLDNDWDEDGGELFISPGALARAAILRQGPLLHWECLPFGGSTTQFDTSGNGRHGTVGAGVTPGTYTGDCDNGSSMVFAGPTGVISRANPGLPTGQQPRAALVRYKANHAGAADIPLFGYGQNGVPFAQFTVSRTILGNDKLIFTSWANDLHFDLPPGLNIADGQEHTIMFVYDGDVTVYAYVDGIESAPGILGIPLQTVDSTVMVGHSPWGWQGAGDEMRQFAVFPDAVSEPDAYLIHAAIEAAVLNRAYTQPQYGNITVSPDFQTITYTPNAGYSGPDQFLYSVSDGQGGASVALVSLIVLGGIVAVDDVVSTSGPITIDVLANDSGTGITVQGVTQGASGSVTTDGTTVTYTPNPLFFGVDSFTYTIEDELGQTKTATVTVTVTSDNNPPAAVDDTATTDQNQPVAIDVLANDADPDGDSIHVGSGSAARPTISSYGPRLFWECLPSSGSTVLDRSGNGLTGTVSGAVFPGTMTGDCDGGTAASFQGGSIARAGTGVLPAGNDARTVLFRFKANFAGPGDIGLFGYGTNLENFAQFSLARTGLGNDKLVFAGWNNDVVIDLPAGTNLGDGAEHTIAVVYDGNRGLTAYVDGVAGPTATLWTDLDTGTSSVVLGQTLYGAAGAGDELRQLVIFAGALGAGEIGSIHAAIDAATPNVAFTQPSNGTVTLSGNTFTYTPALNFVGEDTFTYTVSDGRGGIATATVTVTVAAGIVVENDAPNTQQGTPVTVTVLDNDTAPGGGSLEIVSVTQGANGTVTTDGTTVTYTPNEGFTGTDTFTYTVEDGLGHSATGTVTVTVNGAPVGDDVSVSTQAGTPVTIDILDGVTDPEGDDIEIDSVTQGTNGSVAIVDGQVVYTPNEGFTGTDTFTVTVVDALGAALTLTVTVSVNGAPVGDDVTVTTPSDTPVTIDVLAGVTDPDGDEVTIDSVTQGVNGSVAIVDGEVVYTPNAGFGGTDTFTVTVVDEHGATLVITVTVVVNSAPVGDDAAATTQAGTPVTIDVLAGVTDPDGDDVEIESATQGTNGSVAIVDGEVVYTPSEGFSGTDTFTVTVTDGNGGSLTITVTVTVNGAPVGDDVAAMTQAGMPVTIDVLDGVTDPDGDEVTIDSATQGANGTVAIVDGQVVYTPNDGFTGTDTFTVTVVDEHGGSLTITVTVLVNGAPEGDDVAATTQANTPVVIDILDGVTDPDGDELAIESATQGTNGSVTIVGGSVIYTPNPGFTGTDTFTVTVTDGNGGTLTLTVTVDVTGVLSLILPYNACVAIEVLPFEAGYTSDVWFMGPGTAVSLGLTNHSGGQQAEVGYFPAGTELVFGIVVQQTGYTFVTGPAAGNPDGLVHAVVTAGEGGGLYIVGFEDLYGGGDLDFNDVVFSITAVPCDVTAVDDSAFTQAGTAVGVDVLANDSGTAGSLAVTSVTQGSNGSVTTDGTTVTYTPNAGFSGTDTFTYTTTDPTGITGTATVTITVNGAPVGDNVTVTTGTDASVTIDVLAGVTDPDGDDVEIDSVTQGANGSVTVNGGEVTYTPNASFGGTDTFTVTVVDEHGAELVITVTVIVNSAPTGDDVATSTQTGTPVTIDVLAGVSDPDGDEVTIDSATQGANGSVAIVDGQVVYTPNAGFSGTDTFTVTVTDGNGGTLTITVTVTVNGAPIGDDIEASTQAGQPVTIDALAGVTDPDGDDVAIDSATQGANGSVTVDGDDVTYTPDAGFSGTDSFTVTVTDGNGGSLTITVTVTVNGAPEGDDVTASTQAGTPVTIDVLDGVSDPDGDEVTIDSATQGANGSVAIVDGQVVYTPDAGFSGTDTFTVTVTDGNGGTLTLTVTVTVNGAPAGDDIEAATQAGTPVTIDVLDGVTDPDGDEVTIDSATQGSNGSVAIVDGQVVYTPNAGFSGTDTFTVTVTDGNGGSLTITVTVTVNGAPEGDDVAASTQAGQPVTIDVLAGVTDPDGDEVEIDSATQGANGSVAIVDGQVVYTPNAGFSGTDTFTVTVTDGNGGTATLTVTVTVNGAPVADDIEVATQVDTPVTIDVLDGVTDPDGDEVTIESATQGASGSVTVDGGNVIYTPDAGFSGTDSFTVTVTDGNGGSATITVTVVVNAAPAGDDLEASTQAGQPVTIDVLDGVTDPDGDEVEIESVTQGANGSVTVDGGNVTYTPDEGFSGTDTFTVTVTDGNGGTLTITVTVTVNGPPAGDDIGVTTGAEMPVTIDVLGGVTDPDGDDVEIDSATQGTNGSVTVDGGTATYTPNTGFSGTDTFTVTVTDGNGGTATITVTVTVEPAQRVVMAIGSCVELVVLSSSAAYGNTFWLMSPGAPQSLGITNTDVGQQVQLGYFEAGTELVLGIVVQQTGYTFVTGPGTGNPDGKVHVIVTPGSGNVLATVAFEDLYGLGDADFNDAVVDVVMVDCAVHVADDATTTLQGAATTVAVLDNDDTVAGTLAVTSVTQGVNGSVTTDGTTVTYTPNAGFHGTDVFTYTVENGLGGSATANVVVTVQPLPVVADDAATAIGGAVTVPVLDNDTDPEGTGLTISNVTQGANGSVATDGTTVTYTPNAGFAGTDTFTYTAGNAYGSATATVTVTVLPSSQVILLTSGCLAIEVLPFEAGYTSTVWLMAPGTPSNLGVTNRSVGQQVVLGYFAAGTELVLGIKVRETGYTFVTGPAAVNPDVIHAQVAPGTGNVLYVVGFEDLYGGGDEDYNDVVLNLLVIPCAVAAGDDSANTAPSTGVDVEVLGNDSGTAGSLTVTGVSTPANGSATTDGTTVTYTPNAGFVGTDTFTYTVQDSSGTTATATVSIVVAAAPVAVDDEASTKKGKAVTIDVLANDSGSNLTIQSVTQPGSSKGTVSITGNKVKFTPKSSFTGTVTFSYTVKNAVGQTDTAKVTVFVGNRAPVAVDDTAETPKNQQVLIDVLANDSDPDGDTISIKSIGSISSSTGSATISGGKIRFTPKSGYHGIVTFTYVVQDTDGAVATGTVTLTIGGGNEVPIANPDTVTTKQNKSITIDVLANDTDPDGDTLSIKSVGAISSSKGTASISGGKITFTPKSGTTGTTIFTYVVQDGFGGEATGVVTVNVVANQPPVAVNDSASTPKNTAVTVDVLANDFDPDGDDSKLKIKSVGSVSSSKGSVSITGGKIKFTPKSGVSGATTFTYVVEDEDGGTATGSVTVTVAANQPPVAAADSATTQKNKAVTIDVLANDSDPDGSNSKLKIKSVGSVSSSNGTVSISSNKVVFTPKNNFTGTATFTYVVEDEDGATASTTVTVTVQGTGNVTQGKMTGGGTINLGGGKIHNWGMELRCGDGGGHFSYNNEDLRLHINLNGFTSLVCTDNPSINNGRNFDTVTFTGKTTSGRLGNTNNLTFTLQATVTDGGSNASSDTINLTVKNASNQVIATLSGNLHGGNHEAHNNN